MSRNMRVDARQNRALLLDAAAAAFEIEGFDTPLESVARRAGVSRTTLYRNFPDREALGFAIFERSILELEELSRAVCDRADHAIRTVDEVFALFRHHVVLFLTHGSAHKIAPAIGVSRQRAYDLHNLLLIDHAAVGGTEDRL